ncbi:GTP-binding protein [Roseofilum reptotaenium CS-1145]|uniref:GTP-binding protein n=1 Tax=Roseofilum reptotaenium AO1-A TaxID=1925591 RepID=A0A1L9QV29_9CYAN|nr:GTP-binding protein [Roseofilum reptotaenium]MDB9518718.1 GTP-binding protein [Roseofilum reptotaenium CS-1145]OJJ26514.1 GTP-binding protein [Roseofilum reptotaenium AO1-A]
MSAADFEQELEQTVLSFADIQAELNYKQATESLQSLVSNLDLSHSERSGLEAEIEDLQGMLDKLEQSRVQIAVFGLVGRGKSSVLNALLGDQVFETGPIHGVTRAIHGASWEVCDQQESELVRVTIGHQGQAQIQLIDTPGIDEVNGQQRAALAHEVAKQSDLILFVIAGDMTQVEYEALSLLRAESKPILLVFNKIDQYPDTDRMMIYEKIRDERVKELLSPDEIVMAAACPLVPEGVLQPDGSLGVKLVRGEPQVEDLKLKILELLDREGKSLVALNTMLYADTVNERLVQRKMEIREGKGNQIIWNSVRVKGLAIALNPVTAIDLLSAAIVDVVMILNLSKLYGIQMTQQGALNLLQKIAIAMGGISAGELFANLGLSSLKGLLGLATPVTGGVALAPYLSVAISQAAISALSSYGIGQVTKEYLANGASWGPDGPKAVVSRILSGLDESSILNRIKEELWTKLHN